MPDDKITSSCGATSSKIPDLAQIPLHALERLAARYELGAIKHGKNNWRQGIGNTNYTIERAAHVIYHAYKLINKLEGIIPDDNDDDAAAIMWGGAFLCESTNALQKKKL